ncbi:hypothetical protein PENSPDRAFT_671994 [Peniophora sp. CONT]|nr:hypothetical protein PENSPDRAFT_671994 [Peniophora sp. CONT]
MSTFSPHSSTLDPQVPVQHLPPNILSVPTSQPPKLSNKPVKKEAVAVDLLQSQSAVRSSTMPSPRLGPLASRFRNRTTARPPIDPKSPYPSTPDKSSSHGHSTPKEDRPLHASGQDFDRVGTSSSFGMPVSVPPAENEPTAVTQVQSILLACFTENKALRETQAQLTASLATCREEISRLTEEKARVTETEANNQLLNPRPSEAVFAPTQAEAEIARLREQLSSVVAASHAKDVTLQKLQDQCAELRVLKEQYVLLYSYFTVQHTHVRVSADTAQGAHARSMAHTAELEAALVLCTTDRNNLQAELAVVRDQHHDVSGSLQRVRAESVALQQEVLSLRAEHARLVHHQQTIHDRYKSNELRAQCLSQSDDENSFVDALLEAYKALNDQRWAHKQNELHRHKQNELHRRADVIANLETKNEELQHDLAKAVKSEKSWKREFEALQSSPSPGCTTIQIYDATHHSAHCTSGNGLCPVSTARDEHHTWKAVAYSL